MKEVIQTKRSLYIAPSLIKNPNKRVCVINKEGMLLRVTRSLAAKMIAGSEGWTYTSKSKLKSFLNKEAKLHRNKRAIQTFGTTGGEFTLASNKKRYTYLSLYKFIHSFSRGVQHRTTKALKKMRSIWIGQVNGIPIVPRKLKMKAYRDMSMKNFLEGIKDMPEEKKTFDTGKAIMITRFN